MFSNILDTVRTVSDEQLIAIEAFLMRSALSGTPAVLSPNQAIDSAAIQLISEGNSHNSKNHFIHAIEKGIVRIAIPNTCRSMLDYCFDALKRGEKDPNNEFIFSSLKFLYQKSDGEYAFSYDERMEILRYIYKSLEEYRFRTRSATVPSYLNVEQKQLVNRYIRAIINLDSAVKCYDNFTSKKELIAVYIRDALHNRLMCSAPKSELSSMIYTIIEKCNEAGWPIYRSFYYRLADQLVAYYSSNILAEFKEIVDVCYNKVVAFSMNENAELNISPDFAEIASMQAADNSAGLSTVTSSKILDGTWDKLDWECLVSIYTEVDNICRTKGLSWMEALDKYRSRQSCLPFVLSGKYALVSSVTMAVSAIPVVGFVTSGIVSQFLWDVIVDITGEAVRKPSAKDIKNMFVQAKKNKDMLDIMITQNNKV